MTALLQIRTDWKTRIQQKVQIPFGTSYSNDVLIGSEENDLMSHDYSFDNSLRIKDYYSGNVVNSQPLIKRITL